MLGSSGERGGVWITTRFFFFCGLGAGAVADAVRLHSVVPFRLYAYRPHSEAPHRSSSRQADAVVTEKGSLPLLLRW